MKKKNSLDKIEKVVIGAGCLLIAGLLGLGIYKNQTEEKVEYKSVRKEEKTAESDNSEVKLLAESFTLKQNGDLSKDASDYFEASSEELQDIKINFDEVQMDTAGTYPVEATYKKEIFNFDIIVEESDNPIITAENESFRYFIGEYSSMDEVIEIAGVTAVDKDGNDITQDIMGWEESFPVETGEKEYRLSVLDNYGNTGYLTITVDFQRAVQ